MKIFILIGTGLVVFAIAAFFVVRSIHATAAASEPQHQAVQGEVHCNAQIELATEIAKELEKDRTLPKRVVTTTPHYNKTRKICVVDVAVEEYGEGKQATSILIDPKGKAALLVAVTPSEPNSQRHCFGADAMPLACTDADARWKAYMSQ
jgi:hypothetical protein